MPSSFKATSGTRGPLAFRTPPAPHRPAPLAGLAVYERSAWGHGLLLRATLTRQSRPRFRAGNLHRIGPPRMGRASLCLGRLAGDALPCTRAQAVLPIKDDVQDSGNIVPPWERSRLSGAKFSAFVRNVLAWERLAGTRSLLGRGPETRRLFTCGFVERPDSPNGRFSPKAGRCSRIAMFRRRKGPHSPKQGRCAGWCRPTSRLGRAVAFWREHIPRLRAASWLGRDLGAKPRLGRVVGVRRAQGDSWIARSARRLPLPRAKVFKNARNQFFTPVHEVQRMHECAFDQELNMPQSAHAVLAAWKRLKTCKFEHFLG